MAREIRSKSSMSISIPASRATASRCSTPLVEPPEAHTVAIAFSIDSRVITWPALRSSRSAASANRPASRATSDLSPFIAGTIAEPIGEIPITSNAQAIVLAVNCPPHAPAPGLAHPSSSSSSSSDMSPAACAPIASKTSWIVTSLPRQWPGAIEPP